MPPKRRAAAKRRGKAKAGPAPAATRRVSALSRDVAGLSVDSGDEGESPDEQEARNEGAAAGNDDDEEESAAGNDDEEAAAENNEEEASAVRMKTRQDTNPERKRALQRLVAAIREGDFDDDLEEGEGPGPRDTLGVRARGARLRRRRSLRSRRAVQGDESDSDYVMNADEEEEEEEVAAVADEDLELEEGSGRPGAGDTTQQLRTKEKRLILKFKTARREVPGSEQAGGRSAEPSSGDGGMRLEDIDWAEFDLETINEILARREALRKRRRKERMSEMGIDDDGEITTAKLKKSSLAPPPMVLETVASIRARELNGDLEEGEEPQPAGELPLVDEPRAEPGRNDDAMEVDEGESPEFRDLFEDASEAVPQTPGGGALHLPPRPSAMSDINGQAASSGGSRTGRQHQLSARDLDGRPHPVLLKNLDDRLTDADMRIVLQYELRCEEGLFKDLRAQVLDKLNKLQAEEKLLRMIVKHDFELPEEPAQESQQPIEAAFGGFSVEPDMQSSAAAAAAAAAALGSLPTMDAGNDQDMSDDSASDSGESLSGMSSSSDSSEDEVQNEEIARGALGRVLEGYLPSSSSGTDMKTGS
ncbi:hypothetical protein GGF46_003989 [Coemansia sp. RSA 552]|nr:hypothetical protein GGF46_003989 [Coemansia sp. RSA 552]